MARNFGINFKGRNIVHPGGYDYLDATGMVVPTSDNLNIPIVMGEADAGKSGEVKWFNDLSAATSYLRGGELASAVQMMMCPTPEGNGGASIVGVLVTNNTVQATLSSGGLDLTSVEYGIGGNRIQCKLEDGTLAGTKKFTAYRWDIDTMDVFDNVGAICKIIYTGDSAYAGITIEGTTTPATIKTWVGVDEATSVLDVTVDLTSDKFSTIDSIVRYFNSLSDYSATYTNFDSASLTATSIDLVLSKESIKDTGYELKGIDADLLYRVNTYSTLVNIKISGALSNFDFKYLAGGSEGTSPTSWSGYFDTIKKQFSDILVVLSSSITIQSEAMAHVLQMEQRNQKQVMFTGGATGETSEQIIQRAMTFNSSRAVVAYPGVYHTSHAEGKLSLPSYMTAAMIAGRVSGVDPSEPITFDYFNVIGLENDLISGDTVIDDLISSGVATLERVQNGGIRLAQGITTYTGANNVLYREISVRRGADALSEKMRKTMEETFVGKKGIIGLPASVKSKAIEVLDSAVSNGDISAYGAIVVKQVGTVIYIDYEVAPTEPVNFILVTSHFVHEIS